MLLDVPNLSGEAAFQDWLLSVLRELEYTRNASTFFKLYNLSRAVYLP